jgi:methyl-accepting chemotaxis protein
VDRVAEGSRVVSDSGATFEQVVVSVKKVSDIIAGIADASADQASGIEHVGNAVAKMDELTQQNAALVEEAAAASQTLAEQSNGLRTMMNRYQVRDNAVDPHASIQPVHARRRASDGASDAALDSLQEPEREARRA